MFGVFHQKGSVNEEEEWWEGINQYMYSVCMIV